MFDLKNIDEDFQKSIPSKVFYNHFDAVAKHINSAEILKLKKVKYFNELKLQNKDFEISGCKKLLWNSWSTEYSFGLAKTIDSTEYYKYSLHWNFPQAYYSIYLNMTAFHETQGKATDAHEKSIKIFGNSVKDGHYPKCISFYAAGLHNVFSYNNLDLYGGFPKGYSSLVTNSTPEEYQLQIANFLKTTRKQNAEDKKSRLKSNDNRFQTQSGGFTKQFKERHWNILYETIPVTTILNMLYRLRIKANYHDVEAFINAKIDFKQFHNSLGVIINCLNFVHEAYICKSIGLKEYEKMLDGFNNHLIKDTAIKRLKHIKEI